MGASHLTVIRVRPTFDVVREPTTNLQNCVNKQRRTVPVLSRVKRRLPWVGILPPYVEILDKVTLRETREDRILPTEVQEQQVLDNCITQGELSPSASTLKTVYVGLI